MATLAILNPTTDSIAVETANGCVGGVGIFDWAGTHRVFAAATDSCPPDSTALLLISPGDSALAQWSFVAWERSALDATDSVFPLPGRYKARLHTPSSLPDLETTFVIRPSGYYMGWRRCGFGAPLADDSIVVTVDSTYLGSQALFIWYKVRNSTSSSIALIEVGNRGVTWNGVTVEEGWLPLELILEVQTDSGWEAAPTGLHIESATYPVTLQPNECLQSVTGYNPETGVYRLHILLANGSDAYSEAFDVR